MTAEQHRAFITEIEQQYRREYLSALPGIPLCPNGRSGESGAVAYAAKQMQYAERTEPAYTEAIRYFSALADAIYLRQEMPDVPLPEIKKNASEEAERLIARDGESWMLRLTRA